MTPDDTTIQLLRRLEHDTGRASAEGRDTLRVGPFLAVIHPTDDMVWVSYALPQSQWASPDDAANLPAHLAELREAFATRRRTLRFEYFEALWPTLGPALERAGCEFQHRMPLMVCTPADFRPLDLPGLEIAWVGPDADDQALRQFLATAMRSFGEPADRVDAERIADQRAALQRGTYRSAVARLGGEPVGVGTMTLGNDELVGVGTLPEYRRRGIAAAVCSFQLREHFAQGRPLCWLSAGDEGATSLYRKLGFRLVGDQLNYTDRSPQPQPSP